MQTKELCKVKVSLKIDAMKLGVFTLNKGWKFQEEVDTDFWEAMDFREMERKPQIIHTFIIFNYVHELTFHRFEVLPFEEDLGGA